MELSTFKSYAGSVALLTSAFIEKVRDAIEIGGGGGC